MKKFLAFFLACTMLFLLCGCNALDQMRQQQAFYDNAGNIIYEGVTYQLLPECDALKPKPDRQEGYIYVTPADMPVLLSRIMSTEWLYRSVDGDFLCSAEQSTAVYCRTERYEQISKIIREGFEMTKMCYSFFVWNEELWEYTEQQYMLTEAQIRALKTLTTTVTPQILGDGLVLQYNWGVDLQACSEDLLFRQDCGLIAATENSYYLIMQNQQQQVAFQVPADMNGVFNDITSAYRGSPSSPEADRAV